MTRAETTEFLSNLLITKKLSGMGMRCVVCNKTKKQCREEIL